MKVLALSFVAAAALGPSACVQGQDDRADAGDFDASVSTDAAAASDGSTHHPGDLTGFYLLHVDVVSDTCSPNRQISPDTEVLLWGDRARNRLRIPMPDIAGSGPDRTLHLGQLDVPLEHHVTSDLLVATCPDVRLDIESGPIDISDRHIVVPYTTRWRHTDACSDPATLRYGGPPPPSEDCALELSLSLYWSRACPPPSHTFPTDGAIGVYCE
jgi:hypothetical protein